MNLPWATIIINPIQFSLEETEFAEKIIIAFKVNKNQQTAQEFRIKELCYKNSKQHLLYVPVRVNSSKIESFRWNHGKVKKVIPLI